MLVYRQFSSLYDMCPRMGDWRLLWRGWEAKKCRYTGMLVYKEEDDKKEFRVKDDDCI